VALAELGGAVLSPGGDDDLTRLAPARGRPETSASPIVPQPRIAILRVSVMGGV
jgi:hypothetical protein